MAVARQNLDYLRLAFTQARRAREHGNHPFGAVLVDAGGKVVLAAENSVVTGNDVIAHAELNLLHAASRKYSLQTMATATLYASAEPCPMCAGAIVWANIRRVVFGLGMEEIYRLFPTPDGAAALRLHADAVFAAAPWPIDVSGPLLNSEARLPFDGY